MEIRDQNIEDIRNLLMGVTEAVIAKYSADVSMGFFEASYIAGKNFDNYIDAIASVGFGAMGMTFMAVALSSGAKACYDIGRPLYRDACQMYKTFKCKK